MVDIVVSILEVGVVVLFGTVVVAVVVSIVEEADVVSIGLGVVVACAVDIGVLLGVIDAPVVPALGKGVVDLVVVLVVVVVVSVESEGVVSVVKAALFGQKYGFL